MLADLACLLVAYLLGSLPFSALVARWSAGQDLRAFGSGNPGATNVLRLAGKLPALVALVLDIGKGVAAVVLAGVADAWSTEIWLSGRTLAALAALAAVAGHVWPIFYGFRGGKGVATAFGGLGTVVLTAALASVIVFLVLVSWKRYVSLGSVLAVPAIPLFWQAFAVAGWERSPGWGEWFAAALISAIVVARHTGNIRRLRLGTERRLGNAGI